MNDSSIQVALFPIPNVVAFPGTVVPLHVFEPRYRTMIDDSVAEQRMIAVCHTRKQIRPAKQGQTVEDALKSNQATYDPFQIFSAGLCEIVDKTSDGRVYVNIEITHRLVMEEEIQTLPYRLVRCHELKDIPDIGSDTAKLQREITSIILSLIGRQNPSQLASFDSEHWLAMSPADFSFNIFQMLRFDPDSMQALLESTSAAQRLHQIHTILQDGVANRDL